MKIFYVGGSNVTVVAFAWNTSLYEVVSVSRKDVTVVHVDYQSKADVVAKMEGYGPADAKTIAERFVSSDEFVEGDIISIDDFIPFEEFDEDAKIEELIKENDELKEQNAKMYAEFAAKEEELLAIKKLLEEPVKSADAPVESPTDKEDDKVVK